MSKKVSLIIAVDFDGTLFSDRYNYPDIGKPLKENIKYVKKLGREGHRIVLNTCRAGIALKKAVEACLKEGLVFTAINKQDPIADTLWPDVTSSKVYADVYFDTRAASSIKQLRSMVKRRSK